MKVSIRDLQEVMAYYEKRLYCIKTDCNECTLGCCGPAKYPPNKHQTELTLTVLKAVEKAFISKQLSFEYKVERDVSTGYTSIHMHSLPEGYADKGILYYTTNGWEINASTGIEAIPVFKTVSVPVYTPSELRSTYRYIKEDNDYHALVQALNEFKEWYDKK